MHIKTIYFDMDGVLVDLDEKMSMVLGRDIRKAAPEGKPGADAFVKSLLRTNLKTGIFAHAPPMPEFGKIKDLMIHLKRTNVIEVELLSSCMEHESFDEIKRQKLLWLHMYGMMQFKSHFTTSGAAKAHYASAESLLIDDMKFNCDKFRAAGGFAIQYKNYDQLHKDLFRLI